MFYMLRYHPLFSFSASLFSTIPYHSSVSSPSFAHLFVDKYLFFSDTISSNQHVQADRWLIFIYMYIHVDSIGQSTLQGIIG